MDKQKLYPSTPPLTRYKETTFPIVKKKVVVESFIMDDDIYKHLDELTASKLCIRLNTYKVSGSLTLFCLQKSFILQSLLFLTRS